MFVNNNGKFNHHDSSAFQHQYTSLPTGVYTHSYDHRWDKHSFTPFEVTKEDYVHVSGDTYKDILSELTAFLDPIHIQKLTAAGITNKRGILLHGRPGSGKTSMIMSFMDVIKQNNGIMLVQPDVDLIYATINVLREDDQNRPVFIFWDEFDQMINNEEHEILRFLDGILSVNHVFVFACLNDISRVPTRIYNRPSRFGIVTSIKNLSDKERRLFLVTKFPELTGNALSEAISLTKGMPIDHIKEIGLQLSVYGRSVEEIKRRMYMFKGKTDDES